jgi:hypothetical protein
LREIGVLEQAARFTDDGAKPELDRFEMRGDSLAGLGFQRAEQLIAAHIGFLTFRHADVANARVEEVSLQRFAASDTSNI